MKNLKRVLSLALATVMLLGIMVIGANAAFVDQDSIKYDTAVDTLVLLKVIDGMGGNQFVPNGTLTRAQAAKMVAYVKAGANTTTIGYYDGTTKFEDVTANHAWATGSINYCVATGIINGKSATSYDPDGTLTGAELAKMLLVALGYKAETANKAEALTGGNWMSNAIRMATENKLFVGMDSAFVASKAITREEACQMIFNALSKNLKTVNQAIDGYYTYNTIAATLLTDSFPMASPNPVTTGADAFDRPGTKYTFTSASKLDPVLILDTPVATVKGAMAEKDLFAAIGATGTVNGTHKEISLTHIYVDGKDTATGSDVLRNDLATPAAFTTNGTITEIYATATANQYVAVVIREIAGQVTAVTPANATTGTKRTVTVSIDKAPVGGAATTGYTIETEDFAKGDKVLVTLAENTSDTAYTLKSITAAKTISGKVTKVTNSALYTIGGSEYLISEMSTATVSLNASGSWYVDSMGNIIADKSADTVPVYYGVALEAVGQKSYTPGTLTTPATETFEAVKFMNAKGEVEVLNTAWTQTYDAAGNINGQNFVATGLAAGEMFKYTLTADGKIATVTEATADGSATVDLVKGSAQTGGSYTGYMTDKTVVFLTDGTNTTVSVGYANVPTKSGTIKSYFVANGGTDWAALCVTVSSVAVSTAPNYIYFAGTENTVETTAAGTVTTYTNAYVDGKKVDGGVVVASGTPAVGLFTYTADTKTGKITLTSSQLLASAPGTEITSLQSTYFVAGSAVYTDKETVYYEVDTVNNTITVTTGIPALSTNDTYSVNLLYVDNNSTTVDTAANLVVYCIGA